MVWGFQGRQPNWCQRSEDRLLGADSGFRIPEQRVTPAQSSDLTWDLSGNPRRRRRKCLSICCPQIGSSWLSVHFSSSCLQRTDHSPLRSTRSPLRAGCSSQTSGVCSGGTCGACGGSGSSPHTQSCSSPRSWGHSRRRLGGTLGGI